MVSCTLCIFIRKPLTMRLRLHMTPMQRSFIGTQHGKYLITGLSEKRSGRIPYFKVYCPDCDDTFEVQKSIITNGHTPCRCNHFGKKYKVRVQLSTLIGTYYGRFKVVGVREIETGHLARRLIIQCTRCEARLVRYKSNLDRGSRPKCCY